MQTPQPTLAASPSKGKPFKLTMMIDFSGETYNDTDPADVISRGFLRFVHEWETMNQIKWPYGKPSDLVMGGQVLNITLRKVDGGGS